MARPIMAAEVRALRLTPGEVGLEDAISASKGDRWAEAGFTFCGNARFKERPPNEQRLMSLRVINRNTSR